MDASQGTQSSNKDQMNAPTPPESSDSPMANSQVPTSLDSDSISKAQPANSSTNIVVSEREKMTSEIWLYFKKVKLVKDDESTWRASCNLCKSDFDGKSSNGTSHLWRHYNKYHKNAKTMGLRQTVLETRFSKGKFDLNNFSFDQIRSRADLTEMIIVHEYPLSIVEHRKFKRFCNGLNPLFKMVSRTTVKRDCMKIYSNERMTVIEKLEKLNSRVAVTTDMWTSSSQKKGFMAVTAHYIDSHWKLQSLIISFVFVPCPHTAEALSEALMKVFFDFNIDGKLSTITVDNCTTNDAMLRLILEKIPRDSLLLQGDFFHMRCCAHILNLIVKEGLDVIGDAIEKVRDSVAYWTGTPKRYEMLVDTARQLKVNTGKKLILDWNSTFLMLEVAIEYKNVFSRLKKRESRYKSVPSELDWIRTKEICDKLKIFYKTTELFSSTKYPTTNMHFPKICDIKIALKDWLCCGDTLIVKMAEKMNMEFEAYWSVAYGIMVVEAVLDPRNKADMLEFNFIKIGSSNVDHEVEKIIQLCCRLFKEYEEKEYSLDQSKNSGSSVNNSDEMNAYDAFVARKKRKYPTKTELDSYLEDETLPRAPVFDILGWWRDHEGKYPILSKLARDMLAIPVSTVTSESAFSGSGRLISPHRSRLHEDTVEALMCAQNWLLNKSKDDDLEGIGTIYDDSDTDDMDELMDVVEIQ